MCGIVGVFHFERQRPVDAISVKAQCDTLVHRGPDDGAVYTRPGIGLGHRRLAVVDRAGGRQPMGDESGRFMLVYNGEIYNAPALRSELEGHGDRFRTRSDTEVLLAGFSRWGADVVPRLNGMFAFAVYDAQRHSLFLARDRFGQKPLYYYTDRARFIFGSEIKAIVEDRGVPRTIDAHALADYFALHYVPAPKTIWRSILKLEPGCTLEVDARGPRIRRYFSLDFSHPQSPAPQDIWELLDDAVRKRLAADVPVGALLSGGVDSSAVVAAMAGHHDAVKTHAIGFRSPRLDERKYARHIAGRFGTDHEEAVLDVSATRVLDDLSWYYDEPFADASAIPTYLVCEMARKRVTVALSGDGGDELFGGYQHYVNALWLHSIRKRLRGPHPRLARALPRTLRFSRTWTKLRARHVALYRATLPADRAAFECAIAEPWRWRHMLSRQYLRALGDYDPFSAVSHHFDEGDEDTFDRHRAADLRSYLADDILVKVDRASMAHGLELRSPLLDPALASAALRAPRHTLIRGTETKILLKQAIAHKIPASFFDRPKAGFRVPLGRWLMPALGDIDTLADHGFIDKRRLQEAASAVRSGREGPAAQLHAALVFARWHDRFLSSSPPSRPACPNAAPTEILADGLESYPSNT